MTLKEFNNLSPDEVAKHLMACCGSTQWVTKMMTHFPFDSEKALVDFSTKIWYDQCNESDWRASFEHHPKIGDLSSLKEKFAGKEQASVAAATEDTLKALAAANAEYESKFGFIFIVCATGKSAQEMLDLLLDRLKNSAMEELHIAMGEQQKITLIRFAKLMPEADFSFLRVSQITTHVLDTSLGYPGRNIAIQMQRLVDGTWQTLAQGRTNEDGRIPDLLPQERILKPDTYKMVFDTGSYFRKQNLKTFYPVVEIIFNTFDDAHYHVPLLVNPFGYSTYRGS